MSGNGIAVVFYRKDAKMVRQTDQHPEIRELNNAELEAVAGGNAVVEVLKIAGAWALEKVLDGSKSVHIKDSKMWKNIEAGKGWWL